MAKQKNFKNRNAFKPQHPDPLVQEALNWIVDNTSGVVQSCLHRVGGRVKSFGVYNTITKKYSVHYPENFFPNDLQDIKMVALTTKL